MFTLNDYNNNINCIALSHVRLRHLTYEGDDWLTESFNLTNLDQVESANQKLSNFMIYDNGSNLESGIFGHLRCRVQQSTCQI